MKRQIVTIDEEKCNGCGLCIGACHEGALRLVDGKARLISDVYCDGLGNCLPECPTGAIQIVEREAEAFDEEAVKQRTAHSHAPLPEKLPCGCPGTHIKTFARPSVTPSPAPVSVPTAKPQSSLQQWPVQIKLVPANAPFLENAHLLVAADCTAFAYAGIHEDFMRNKITLIGCPKLDEVDYAEKLTAILKAHEIKSVTVLRMDVPCCGGLVNSVKQALTASGKMIPWRVVVVSTDGQVLED